MLFGMDIPPTAPPYAATPPSAAPLPSAAAAVPPSVLVDGDGGAQVYVGAVEDVGDHAAFGAGLDGSGVSEGAADFGSVKDAGEFFDLCLRLCLGSLKGLDQALELTLVFGEAGRYKFRNIELAPVFVDLVQELRLLTLRFRDRLEPLLGQVVVNTGHGDSPSLGRGIGTASDDSSLGVGVGVGAGDSPAPTPPSAAAVPPYAAGDSAEAVGVPDGAGSDSGEVPPGLRWDASPPPVDVPSFEDLTRWVAEHSRYRFSATEEGAAQHCAECGAYIAPVTFPDGSMDHSHLAEAKHVAHVIRERLLNQ